MADGIARAEEATRRGLGAILNLLGEHHHDQASVDAAVREYIDLLDAIRARKLDACLSIKPTQCGLMLGEEAYWTSTKKILDRVRSMDGFLWMDMEGSRFTDPTLAVYRRALAEYPEVGVAVQANLRRTERDVASLLEVDGIVRLVKGAYREPPPIGTADRRGAGADYPKPPDLPFQRGGRLAGRGHHTPKNRTCNRKEPHHPPRVDGRPDVPPGPEDPHRAVQAEELGGGHGPLRCPRRDHRLPELHGRRHGAGDEGARDPGEGDAGDHREDAGRDAREDPPARGARPPEGAADQEDRPHPRGSARREDGRVHRGARPRRTGDAPRAPRGRAEDGGRVAEPRRGTGRDADGHAPRAPPAAVAPVLRDGLRPAQTGPASIHPGG